MKVLRITAFAAALTMLTSTLVSMPVYAVEAPVATATTEEKQTYSGKYGAQEDDITWTYQEETETLTFSGSGKMIDDEGYTYFQEWRTVIPEDKKIKNVVFEDGITNIGYVNYSYFDHDFLLGATGYSVTIPESAENYVLFPSYAVKGMYGSELQYYCARNGIEFVGIGIAKNPLYADSGISSLGAKWKYDYATETLSVYGPGFIACMDPDLPPFKWVIFDSNVTIPKSDTSEWNSQMFNWLRNKKIYCYKNSEFGQEYENICNIINTKYADDEDYQDICKSFHVSFLDDPLIGDVDLDGKVTLADAVLLSKAVNGSVAISDAQKISMDCDGDGDITANDTTALMQFLVHLVDTLPLK